MRRFGGGLTDGVESVDGVELIEFWTKFAGGDGPLIMYLVFFSCTNTYKPSRNQKVGAMKKN